MCMLSTLLTSNWQFDESYHMWMAAAAIVSAPIIICHQKQFNTVHFALHDISLLTHIQKQLNFDKWYFGKYVGTVNEIQQQICYLKNQFKMVE